jgi:hypothetical protein
MTYGNLSNDKENGVGKLKQYKKKVINILIKDDLFLSSVFR